MLVWLDVATKYTFPPAIAIPAPMAGCAAGQESFSQLPNAHASGLERPVEPWPQLLPGTSWGEHAAGVGPPG